MNRKLFLNLFVIIAMVLPVIYLALIYPKLPTTVGLHFGFDGKPDRTGDKSELITSTLIMTLVNVFVYLLLTNIHKIDPKKTAVKSKGIMHKIAIGVVVFVTAVNFMIIQSSIENRITFDRIILPMMGLLFAYLGNLMYSVKQNYFFGLRTPWALEDEDNWRKTHQLAAKFWFVGGILIAVLSALLPFRISFMIMFSIVFLITLIPAIYSYRYFRQHRHTNAN